ncbi:hypothetical protein F5148DRAFT_38909 [Russula earlei]|uniref:Uncharacterized protein n=1 Tax=Russula earlei TaxID=71964 RepID=A0ACC0U8F0_9AGAM|nr:hypothetical protein F5148DRAFT_38909 [Russula earlei]
MNRWPTRGVFTEHCSQQPHFSLHLILGVFLRVCCGKVSGLLDVRKSTYSMPLSTGDASFRASLSCLSFTQRESLRDLSQSVSRDGWDGAVGKHACRTASAGGHRSKGQGSQQVTISAANQPVSPPSS